MQSEDASPSERSGDLRALWEKTLGPEGTLDGVEVGNTYRPRPLLPLPEAAPIPQNPHFETLDLIGRGGMGEVYRARQSSLEREVALKRLRQDKDRTRQRRAFVAEAVVTGRLEHPNIVPVYAMGNEGGTDYLAMKLVGGRSWKQLLLAQPDALNQHLEILLQLCNAVAFAHSRGIVHNDLKPSNVMVGEFGEVTLLDWGNAVSIAAEPDKSIRHRSQIQLPCGTPLYMAPELALGRGDQIGTWTDVYLLGAILYEILTGGPPHRGPDPRATIERAASASRKQLPDSVPTELRAICARALRRQPAERFPDVPSFQAELRGFLRHRESLQIVRSAQQQLRISRERSTLNELEEAQRAELYQGFAEAAAGFKHACELWPEHRAAARGLQASYAACARAALRLGDLGLAASQAHQLVGPERAELLDDVRVARRRRRAGRRARRRLQVGLGVALTGLLVGLLVGNLLLQAARDEVAAKNIEVERQRAVAEQQRGFAEQRGEIAQRTLDQVTHQVQTLLEAELADARGYRIGKQALQIAVEGWRELRDTDLDRGTATRGTALARLRLGRLLLDIDGDAPAALVEFEASVAALEELAAQTGAPDLAGSLALARLYLGDACRVQGRLDEAEAAYGAALVSLRALAEQAPSDVDRQRNLALCLVRRGNILELAGDAGAARRDYTAAVALYRSLDGSGSGPAAARVDLASALDKLGDILRLSGDMPAARRAWEESLAIRRGVLQADPDQPVALRYLSFSLLNVGDASNAQGEHDQAEACFLEALQIRRRLQALHPQSALAQKELTVALERCGNAAMSRADFGAARGFYDASLELDRLRVAQDSSNFKARLDLAISLVKCGDVALSQQRVQSCAEFYHESLRLLRSMSAEQPRSIKARTALIQVIEQLGELQRESGDFEAARATLAEGRELILAAVQQDTTNAELRQALASISLRYGDVQFTSGNLDSAELAFAQALSTSRALHSRDPSQKQVRRLLYLALIRSGELRLNQRRSAEAAALFEDAVRLGEADLVGSALAQSNQSSLLLRLGDAYQQLQRPLDALASFASAAELRGALSDARPDDFRLRVDHAIALHRCAQAAEALAAPRQRVVWLERAVAQTLVLVQQSDEFAPDLQALQTELGEAREQARLQSLIDGRGSPSGPEDWQGMAGLLARRGLHGRAFGCFQRAFALQDEPHGLDLLAAARSAAQLVAAEARAQARSWLQGYLAQVRLEVQRLEARAAEPGAAEQLGSLRDYVRGLRDEEPAFAGEDFQQLFEGF